MITRPSTPRLLEGVIAELEALAAPLLIDDIAAARLNMVVATLRHCAERAEHEIHLMNEEADQYLAYANDIAARAGEAALTSALAAAEPAPTQRLTDVARAYDRAGEAFAAAIETAFRHRWHEAITRAENLLAVRVDNECAMTMPVGVGR